MARFHPLKVTDVERTIRDAVVVTLEPENGAAAEFAFTPGQYLTFRHDFDGTEIRRSYSICTARGEGALKVGIKRVQGGAFSNWANDNLKPGDVIEAMPPAGRFTFTPDPAARNHYLGFAGGSGITPILSILKTALAEEPNSSFTLVYANKAVSTIMFREELEDLKNRYLGRLNVIHVLETDAQEIDLFTGLVDEEKCALLFRHWIDIKAVDTTFICGPEPMMQAIRRALKTAGVPDERVRVELFQGTQQGRLDKPVAVGDTGAASGKATARVTVKLDGVSRSFDMDKGETRILDAARAHAIDAPFSCKAGVCSTCRARLIEGEVEMVANNALEDHEVADGYVLTCQCLPVSDRIVLDYDQ